MSRLGEGEGLADPHLSVCLLPESWERDGARQLRERESVEQSVVWFSPVLSVGLKGEDR